MEINPSSHKYDSFGKESSGGNSEPPSGAEKPKKKNAKIYIWVTAAILLVAFCIFFYWLLYARFHRSTDDAYVHGNQVKLTPQIPGIVTNIHFDDTELVEEGQVLIELDTTDREIALGLAEAKLADTVRNVVQKFQQVYLLAAQLESAKGELIKTQIFYMDRDALKDTGAISIEDYVAAEMNFVTAKGQFESIEFALMKAISEVKGTTVQTHPLVREAAEAVRDAWVSLERCKIRAPVTGLIAQRHIQVGTSVDPSTALLAIVPLSEIWVNANFKEVHLEKIRIGQPVKVTSDVYGGDVVYRGEVVGLAGGTGAVFSAIPPQNATGNWIKIVQRLPVRVKLHPKELKQYPLRLGLSMHANVDVRDQTGPRVPSVRKDKKLYATTVFEDQEKGADIRIKGIISENIFFETPISTLFPSEE